MLRATAILWFKGQEPGDVQWMTAGSGLVHSEMPEADFVRSGGSLEGFQVWINLPKQEKMTRPHYQELKAASIPVALNSDGTVTARVVAGNALGARGPIETHTPVLYVHFTMAPGTKLTLPIPPSYNALAYVIRGRASFAGTGDAARESDIAIFEHDGEQVDVANEGDSPLEFLFLAGEPLGEPVARYGPFVMNTREELKQAFTDYRSGKMGVIG